MALILSFRREVPPPTPLPETFIEDILRPNPWHTPVGEVLDDLVRRGTVRRQHGLAMLEALMETSVPWEEVPEVDRVFHIGRLEWWSEDLVDNKVFVGDLIQRFMKNAVENKGYVQECLRRVESANNKGPEAKIISFKPQFTPPESLRASLTRLDSRLAYYDSNLVWHQATLHTTLRAIYVLLLTERVPGRLASSKPPPESPRKGILDSILPWLPDRKSR